MKEKKQRYFIKRRIYKKKTRNLKEQKFERELVRNIKKYRKS